MTPKYISRTLNLNPTYLMAEAIYTVTYILFDAMLGMKAWHRTEPGQFRPHKDEVLHFPDCDFSISPHVQLSAQIVQVDRDLATGHFFAICRVINGEVHEHDDERPFWLTKGGWEKRSVDRKIKLLEHSFSR